MLCSKFNIGGSYEITSYSASLLLLTSSRGRAARTKCRILRRHVCGGQPGEYRFQCPGERFAKKASPPARRELLFRRYYVATVRKQGGLFMGWVGSGQRWEAHSVYTGSEVENDRRAAKQLGDFNFLPPMRYFTAPRPYCNCCRASFINTPVVLFSVFNLLSVS
ncbi:MAG: hypothetical protein JWN37_129 [Candidatus Nomurabacteria bacterium]|nr:hypothetical protein [Candidatus Nomurabacteria bacterium]